jgi:predicted membrane chloride channel (bestrophin family)
MMVAFTFLLTFKCSFSYNRYWEGCTAIHQMQSKWLDVGMELAAFHLQSERFAQIRPPAFGEHPHIDHVIRKRERQYPMTPKKLKDMLSTEDALNSEDPTTSSPKKIKRSFFRRRSRKKDKDTSTTEIPNQTNRSINMASNYRQSQSLAAGVFNFQSPKVSKRPGLSKLSSVPDLSGGMSKNAGPSLFLQEASHLLSLLSAVSFATLRNDIETAESPLQEYVPGSPWPPVDPDAKDAGEYDGFYNRANSFVNSFQYVIGNVRSPTQRTVYNACRPFKVLGGVSDAEVDLLQRARGPLAKTALCTMWLQEFMSREFLNGSLGKVSPPIVSRLFQYTSDGMLGYNQARKVAYVPFPFPHSQLTTFFLIVVIFFLPILMLTFVQEVIVATILNSMTVGVFFGKICSILMMLIFEQIDLPWHSLTIFVYIGLWSVANELEDPFRNVPNDLPLNNFQAQFNEALVCMFAGFHPEAWWDIDESKEALEGDFKPSSQSSLLSIPEKAKAEN